MSFSPAGGASSTPLNPLGHFVAWEREGKGKERRGKKERDGRCFLVTALDAAGAAGYLRRMNQDADYRLRFVPC